MRLQAFSLAEQQKLCQAHLIDLERQVSPGPGQGCWSTLHQLCRPREVIGVIVSNFQSTEQGIIVQPVRLVVAELLKSKLQIRAHADPVPATAVVAGGELVVTPEHPLDGVAPGQTAVVYVGTRVLGQCTIDRTESAVPVDA